MIDFLFIFLSYIGTFIEPPTQIGKPGAFLQSPVNFTQLRSPFHPMGYILETLKATVVSTTRTI